MRLDLFFKFCTVRGKKMNEQKKEKDITVLLKLFFFFYRIIIIVIVFFVGTKLPPPHVFVVRETSNTSEMSGRKRGGGWRCFHALLISRGGLALY